MKSTRKKLNINEAKRKSQTNLKEIQQLIEKHNITPENLRTISQTKNQQSNAGGLSVTRMEDIILMLSAETESQAKEIRELKQQMTRYKTIISTLKKQLLAIQKILKKPIVVD